MERDHTQEIGLLAYHLWEASGRPAGQDLAFWLQAEKQLLGCHLVNGQERPARGEPKHRSTPVHAAKRKHHPPPAGRKAASRATS